MNTVLCLHTCYTDIFLSIKSFTESRFTNAYGNLISQSPDKFWTSGQWMTERKGGSDVGKLPSCVCRITECAIREHFIRCKGVVMEVHLHCS